MEEDFIWGRHYTWESSSLDQTKNILQKKLLFYVNIKPARQGDSNWGRKIIGDESAARI